VNRIVDQLIPNLDRSSAVAGSAVPWFTQTPNRGTAEACIQECQRWYRVSHFTRL